MQSDEKVIIVQNDPEVPPAAYADHLREWDVPFTVVFPFAGGPLPLPEESGGIIVLGGSMGVHDTDRHPFLVTLKEWIAAAVAREVPFFGICLGGQLLADVLGAPVLSPSPWGEKGTLPVTLTPAGDTDHLFAGVAKEFVTFQWHNDAFHIPKGSVRLAGSDRCPNQAFRFGPSAWGVQFHPEMTTDLVTLWAGWSKETASDAALFADAFSNAEKSYRDASKQLLANFLRISSLL